MLFGATVEETCAFDSAGETIEAAETDAAVAEEEEICGEARAQDREDGPVEAADTDVAAAEEEACGEARALGRPVEAADTDVAAAEEQVCGEARTLGKTLETADTETAAAEEEKTCAVAEVGAGARGGALEAAFGAPET